ncbi:MAG: Blue-light-activated protein, partial [Myxococcaceae bacterium]|nr:Blue-light-activated protein [Myxococcaceae bacterium]
AEDESLTGTAETYRIAGVPGGMPLTAGQFLDLVVHPGDRAAVGHAYADAVKRRVPYEIEHRILRPDGEIRWVHERATLEGEGVRQRMIGTIQDITDRRRAIEQLRSSEESYRRIIETTSEGVWLSDAQGTTTFVNQRMAEMLGYQREEMLGKNAYSFVADAGRVVAEDKLARRRRGLSDTYENCYRRKDGTTLWALAKTNSLADESGAFAGTLALLGDMTEQRTFEEARDRLATIVESSDDAIMSETLEGVITTWNHAAEKLFGYNAKEIIGRPLTILIPPDLGDEEPKILARIARGERIEHFDTVRLRKDGSRVEVSVLISSIKDAQGRAVGASKIARDITERRKQEVALHRAEEQVRQSQKMEAIGVLAGGVAHDFNNLLSVILSYTNLVIDDLPPKDPIRGDLTEVINAAGRAADLTRQLLAFSRRQMLQPKVLDLNRIVDGLHKMLVRMLGDNVALEVMGEPTLGKLYADAGQLEQVLMNLVLNARDALPVGGSVALATSNVVLDEEYVVEHPGVEMGSYVLLMVSDTGTGMSEATRERIFEPFFTTKETGKGTGLGLSTVYGIVQQSGGHIRVESELGSGTTFRVYLPRTDRAADSQPALPVTSARHAGTETILLVEDEDQVRAATRAILVRQGYRVLDAQNGGEAFLISEQLGAPIHMLLTDVIMPRMNGRELAERLRPQRPDMKVLYVSGFLKDAVLDAGVAFLPKPLTPEVLATKVREVLDGVPRQPAIT